MRVLIWKRHWKRNKEHKSCWTMGCTLHTRYVYMRMRIRYMSKKQNERIPSKSHKSANDHAVRVITRSAIGVKAFIINLSSLALALALALARDQGAAALQLCKKTAKRACMKICRNVLNEAVRFSRTLTHFETVFFSSFNLIFSSSFFFFFFGYSEA